MCGHLSVLNNENSQFSEEQVENFKSKGYFVDDHVAIGFGGLCPEDLLPEQQPYHFSNGRYTLILNGEIYNDVELRNKLKKDGYHFDSESVLEVIAKLFLDKNVQAFSHLRGRFSIFIWDSKDKIVYGARDSFGSKSLYYVEGEKQVIFATEEKYIISALDDAKVIDHEALQHYFTFQYVPEPLTLMKNIRKVEPGHYFIKELNKPIEFARYFHATFQPVITEQKRMISWIRDVLIESVHIHMRTELPLGSLLSGGIDSSLIVALAKEVNPNIKTFTVGFEHEGFSEIEVAQNTAEQLGVDNISYVISQEEYIEKLPEIIWHMEDPLADPSCVPLYFVAREAKKHVEAVLSGEGADELFGGYNIYREPGSLKVFQAIPNGINHVINKIATTLPEGVKGKSFLIRGTTPLKDRYIGNAKMFEENEKEELLKQYDKNAFYQTITEKLYRNVTEDHLVQQMQYIDMHTWLPGDILLKGNKMMKAHALQLRLPFLDKEVFEVARKIPVDENIAGGTTKLLLRNAFSDLVPESVLFRKKLGFPVPIRHWLKEDSFYHWTQGLIRESETDHLLDKTVVLKLLTDHRQGKSDHSRKIWTVLIFMIWHQIFIEEKYSFAKNESTLETV
ncbi:asparagine synthase (glutamine-hydrolyzing) [Pseudogracilibacillus auburnensis]|uniref:asparagine synthase (glutamine-hydrolyzing) n=1 Tax=Pseudogracilibacillus auburnensis TaxID=1494959 RepID=A0A2V3VGA3_9BACI|nr:asparagine synthase (glutamine-hydrolyzing) [Pseudogracilibacillus auburnensis]PXW80833.1 asparagine synthase (glutamine-hydrolysing) [Pseudogracilibacillus auburnensis]